MRSLESEYRAWFGPVPAGATVVSAPGRLELAGNHTDHQGGHVIAAGLTRRIWGLAAPRADGALHLHSAGFSPVIIPGGDSLEPREEERGTSAAILRGAAAMACNMSGGSVRGLNIVIDADLPSGMGLSSSAAFELVCLGACLAVGISGGDGAFGGCVGGFSSEQLLSLSLAAVEIEQRYFGKACGAQDQTASAFGGVAFMDFKPVPHTVRRLGFAGVPQAYVACLISSRCDHGAYIDDYESVPGDMFSVARLLGADRLGDVPASAFEEHAAQVAEKLGDIAVSRACHFYAEDARVLQQIDALESGDFERYLTLARESGWSSEHLLQSICPKGAQDEASLRPQKVLDTCAELLGAGGWNSGAWRIHGGGFGGSILAFVPRERFAQFRERLSCSLGYDDVMVVEIDSRGLVVAPFDTADAGE